MVKTTDQSIARWLPACAEYFDHYSGGRFDPLGQYWFIFPRDEIVPDAVRGLLLIGSAGCDGITFCYVERRDGIWAHYPIEDDLRRVAGAISELERGWLAGEIKV